jgi:4a-hydroxytetrahydrobiopterin dehydratase
MTEIIEGDELDERLEELDIWGVETGKLVTRVEFDGYTEAVFFANMVFSLAEEEFHHPEVTVEYGAVEIDLWSHEEEAITGKDLEMAEKIEERLGKINWS